MHLASTCHAVNAFQSGNADAAGAWTAEANGPGTTIAMATVKVLYNCSGSGTATLYFRPEAIGGATVYTGSWLRVETLN
jgi:hypothetical protein